MRNKFYSPVVNDEPLFSMSNCSSREECVQKVVKFLDDPEAVSEFTILKYDVEIIEHDEPFTEDNDANVFLLSKFRANS